MNNFNWDNLEGAIFDLDGTLVDSMHYWQSMGSMYLKLKNIEAEEGLNEKLYPFTIIQTAEYLNKTYGLNLDKDTIIKECNGVMENKYSTDIKLKPFVRNFLDLLKEKKIPMYIATATDRPLVEIALKSNNIEHYFVGIITSTEAQSAKATSPRIFDMALEALGTAKEKTIVFEDSYFAMITAKKAKYPVAAVYDNAAKDDNEAIKETADWYSDTFEDYVKALR